jgi:toxin ParE1/3/4
MPKYTLSKEADKDLEDILFYTKVQWGEEQFKKYAGQIYEIFARISENPHIGIMSGYISPDTRKIAVDKHIIFYKVKSGKVLILRILHSSVDIENLEF